MLRDLITQSDSNPGEAAPAKAAPNIQMSRGSISCLAFGPDGKRLIAGTSGDATLFVWQIRDGRLLRTIPGAHGKSSTTLGNPRLNCVAVTPDGRRMMSVGQTTKPIEQTKLRYGSTNVTMSEVKFWDIETGRCVADYHGDEDYGFGYGALSPDGRRVAVADFSRLRILDAENGRSERTIDLPGSWGRQPEFSPDGTLVAMPLDNTIGLFEISTGRRLLHNESMPVGDTAAAAWSPSGDRLVTGHADGFVRAWDVATGKLIWHKLLAPVINRSGWTARPAFVGFSHDGKLVATAGRRDEPVKFQDGIVAFYEGESGRTIREVPLQEVRWAARAADDRMVVVATSHGGYGDTHFIGIDVGMGQPRWVNPPDEQRGGFYPVAGIGFEAKSPWFKAALRGGAVIRFNSLTGREQRRFLAEWRTADQQKARKPREPDMWHATFSADGQTMVSSQMEWIYVWDTESGTLRRQIRHPHQHGCILTLAPDGRTLATADVRYAGDQGEHLIRLYDVQTGEQVLTLEPGDARTSVMAFSPDSQRLFTGFGQGHGIVWSTARGRPPSSTAPAR